MAGWEDEDEDEDITSYVIRLHHTCEAYALVIRFPDVETQTQGE